MKQLQRSTLKDEKLIVKKVLGQKDECPNSRLGKGREQCPRGGIPIFQIWKRTRTTSKGRGLTQKDECPKPKLQAWKRTRTTSKGRDPHIPDLEMDMNNVQGEK